MSPNTTADLHLVWLYAHTGVRDAVAARLKAHPLVMQYNPDLLAHKRGDAKDYLRLPSRETFSNADKERKTYMTIPLCPGTVPRLSFLIQELDKINDELGGVLGYELRGRSLCGRAYVHAMINTKTHKIMRVEVMSDHSPTLGPNTYHAMLQKVDAPTTMFSGNGYAEAAEAAYKILAHPSFKWTWPLLARDVKRQVEKYREP